MPSRVAIETAINLCLAREREERKLADNASDKTERDTHFMRAERYADQAWAIAEDNDIAFIPSDIWARYGERLAPISPTSARESSPLAV